MIGKIGGTVAAALGIGALTLIGVVLLIATYVSYSNQEVRLRNDVVARIQARDVVFDKTWKIVKQQAGVTDKYQQSFKEVYASLMGERYAEGEAQLAKFVNEANPNFESRLFEKLMDSIEGQRNEFAQTEKELIDRNREHTDLLTTFPGSLLLFNRDVIVVKNITSDRTREAARTGVDNDTELFTPTPTPSPSPSPSPTAKRRAARQDDRLPLVLTPPAR